MIRKGSRSFWKRKGDTALGELSRGQRDAVLFGAAAGAMGVSCAGLSIWWALPALAVSFGLYSVIRKALPEGKGLSDYMPLWMLVGELLFLILAAAKTAAHAADCWPGHSSWQLFALVLLALAGAASLQGTDAVGRVAVLLTLGCVLFYVPVLGAAAWEAKPQPEIGEWMEGFPILLTSLTLVCGLFLPSQKRSGRLVTGLAVFTVLLLWCTRGKDGPMPLLEAVRGITLFGVFQRFEALASCALTAGLFLMLALFASAGGEIVRSAGAGKYGGLAVILPAALTVWWVDAVHPAVFAVGAGLFWGILPLLVLPVVARKNGRKNSENREKSS